MRKPKNVFVYLLHFHRPIAPGRHTCQHYMGSAEDLQVRLAQQRAGAGAKLCKVAIERGIDWELARVWEAGPDGRKLEKKLKSRHNGKALCPICSAGGERVIGEDVNFYPMPADFAGALEDLAKGITWGAGPVVGSVALAEAIETAEEAYTLFQGDTGPMWPAEWREDYIGD